MSFRSKRELRAQVAPRYTFIGYKVNFMVHSHGRYHWLTTPLGGAYAPYRIFGSRYRTTALRTLPSSPSARPAKNGSTAAEITGITSSSNCSLCWYLREHLACVF